MNVKNSSVESAVTSYQSPVTSYPPTVAVTMAFLDSPVVRWCGVVLILFLITLVVGSINLCIWFSERSGGLCRCTGSFLDTHGAFKGTKISFRFGGRRSGAVGHMA